MRRILVCTLAWVAGASSASAAELSFGGGVSAIFDPDRELVLLRPGLGLDLRLDSVLALDGRLFLHVPSEGGAALGGGGEIGTRIVPWSGRVRPFAELRAGLSFFGEPFLESGAAYVFSTSLGAGTELSLGGPWWLRAHGAAVHLSNGQGFGLHNPALDGVEVGVALMHRVGEPVVRRRLSAGAPEWGVVLEGVGGRADEQAVGLARLRMAGRLIDQLGALLEGEAGVVGELDGWSAGAGLTLGTGRFRALLFGELGRLSGLDQRAISIEAALTLVTGADVVVHASHRVRTFGNEGRAAAVLRGYPIEDLRLELGFEAHPLEAGELGPVVGLEWTLPLPLPFGIGVFAERSLGFDRAGVRLSFPQRRSLVGRDRRIWRRI